MSAPETKLTFTWYAWAKLKHACQKFDTEVSGFGITSLENPLLVEDFITVKQECSSAYTEMDDVGIADFFDEQIEKGLQPVQFGRIWIHTHPSGVNGPSGTDETTFEKVFGKCDWAIMFILTRSDVTYCALQFNKGPKARINIPVSVSYDEAYPEWSAELEKNVNKKTTYATQSNYCSPYGQPGSSYGRYPEYGSYYTSQEYKKRSDDAIAAHNNAVVASMVGDKVETKKEIFGAGGNSDIPAANSGYHTNRSCYLGQNSQTKDSDFHYGKRTYAQTKEGWVEKTAKVVQRYYEANPPKKTEVEDQLANPVQERQKTVEEIVTEAEASNVWSDMYGID